MPKTDKPQAPHETSCVCCRERRVCHVCFKPVSPSTRCTSGACPECCRTAHVHPNTR